MSPKATLDNAPLPGFPFLLRFSRAGLAIGPTSYRPNARPGKQPENSSKRCRVGHRPRMREWLSFVTKSEPPVWGRQKGVTPSCSHLFQFVPISPFSSDLFRFALLVFRNTPISSDSSDLLRFLQICSDLFSEQIRTDQGNPFLPTPFANPRQNDFQSNSEKISRDR